MSEAGSNKRAGDHSSLICMSHAMSGSDLSELFNIGDDHLDASRTKRNRRSYSCKNCRRRKIKCDREFPCQSCKTRGISNTCRPDVSHEKYSPSSDSVDIDMRPEIRKVMTAPAELERSASTTSFGDKGRRKSSSVETTSKDERICACRHRLPVMSRRLDHLFRRKSILSEQLDQIDEHIESAQNIFSDNASPRSISSHGCHNIFSESSYGSVIANNPCCISQDTVITLFEQVMSLDHKVSNLLRTLASITSPSHTSSGQFLKDDGPRIDHDQKQYHFSVEDMQLFRDAHQWPDPGGVRPFKAFDPQFHLPHHSHSASAALETASWQ